MSSRSDANDRLPVLKISALFFITLGAVLGCTSGKAGSQPIVIAQSKSREATIFRQNCAICHGPEADGKTVDGRIVPSLRSGEFKKKTEDEIYQQLSNGGNGMLSFRQILSERELRMMARFVVQDIRGGK